MPETKNKPLNIKVGWGTDCRVPTPLGDEIVTVYNEIDKGKPPYNNPDFARNELSGAIARANARFANGMRRNRKMN